VIQIPNSTCRWLISLGGIDARGPHYSQAIEWRAPFWIDYGRGNEAQEQKTVGWFSMTAMHYLSLIPTEYPNAREGSINSHLEAVCQLSQSRQ
jgi:hypothetical protein